LARFTPRQLSDASGKAHGQAVFGRIENQGTEPVLYGAPYRIEKRDGTSWSLAPESPDNFILPLYDASPGESGDECSFFSIPSSMAPGHYRMTKEVGFGRPARKGEATILTAEFDILP
jgi:Big-like domain-containing protein